MNKWQLLPDCHVQCYSLAEFGQLLRDRVEDCRSYLGHLTCHLATALFCTGCWFHQWGRLTMDRLVREPTSGVLIPRTSKGSFFRDLPLTRELSASLEEWEAQAGKNLPRRFQLCGLHQRAGASNL